MTDDELDAMIERTTRAVVGVGPVAIRALTNASEDVRRLAAEVRRMRAVLERLPRCACAGLATHEDVSHAVRVYCDDQASP